MTKSKLLNIIISLLICTTFAVIANVLKAQYSLVLLLIFISIYFVLSRVNIVNDFKYQKSATYLAFIFSLFQTVGFKIVTSEILSFEISDILMVVSYFVIFRILLLYILNYLIDYKHLNNELEMDNNKVFRYSLLIIFIAWLPYIIIYFPGIFSTDSISQLKIIYGTKVPSNHHPYFVTLVIGLFVKVGELIGLGVNSVFAFILFQSIMCMISFAFVIKFLHKRKINKYIIFILLAFFALYPIYPMYSITLWKDIPFAFSVLWYVMYMIELIENPNDFIKNKSKVILLMIFIFLSCITRNNGLYAIALTVPFIVLFAKKDRIKVLVMYTIPIVLTLIIIGPVYNALNVEPSKAGEALGIQLQQIARIEKYHGLSDDQYQRLTKFFNVDENMDVTSKYEMRIKIKSIEDLGDKYKEYISDPVKYLFKAGYYQENSKEFLMLWIDIIADHPKTAVEATLRGSVGYYYPDYQYGIIAKPNNKEPITKDEKQLMNYAFPKVSNYTTKVVRLISKTPIISLLFSRGLMTWAVMLLSVVYTIRYNKKYLVPIISILFIILTAMASPVAGEFRYVYSSFVVVPLLLGYIFTKKIEKKEGN